MTKQDTGIAQQPAGNVETRLKILALFSYFGWALLVGGFILAGIAFDHAVNVGRDMGMRSSDVRGIVAALPGLNISALGLILIAVTYNGRSGLKSQIELDETLAKLNRTGV